MRKPYISGVDVTYPNYKLSSNCKGNMDYSDTPRAVDLPVDRGSKLPVLKASGLCGDEDVPTPIGLPSSRTTEVEAASYRLIIRHDAYTCKPQDEASTLATRTSPTQFLVKTEWWLASLSFLAHPVLGKNTVP